MGWEYVIPGYLLAVVTFGSYTFAVLRRGRRVSREVPEGKRRFLDG